MLEQSFMDFLDQKQILCSKDILDLLSKSTR